MECVGWGRVFRIDAAGERASKLVEGAALAAMDMCRVEAPDWKSVGVGSGSLRARSVGDCGVQSAASTLSCTLRSASQVRPCGKNIPFCCALVCSSEQCAEESRAVCH